MRSFLYDKTERITKQINILLDHKVNKLLILLANQLKEFFQA